MNQNERIIKIKLHPTQIIVIGFALVIIAGTFLLSLPISVKPDVPAEPFKTTFIDALFTSTSAVCVTGLTVVDTATHWSVFGQIIILLLIQIGGLGFMTFSTLFAFVVGRRISFRERVIMQEALNQFKLSGIVKITRNILIMTFGIEGAGAILLAFAFVPVYGFWKGVGFSIFHSVSAFCNAGFDLIGHFNSLTPFVNNTMINVVIMILIILGGLGFTVIMDVIQKRRFDKLTLHSKMVLRITAVLIVFGAIGFFLLEMNNPLTIGGIPSVKGKILASFFQSVTSRTAGFNTIDIGSLTTGSLFLTIILMFIGGSSGSTAGGVKTTTIGVVLAMVLSVVKGREDTEVFHKKIPMEIIKKSIAIVVLALGLIMTVTLILSITEAGHSFLDILFVTTSAFGTVGLDMGLSPELSYIGKILISLTMFIGRVGPLTIFLALIYRKKNVKVSIKYPEEKVIVG